MLDRVARERTHIRKAIRKKDLKEERKQVMCIKKGT